MNNELRTKTKNQLRNMYVDLNYINESLCSINSAITDENNILLKENGQLKTSIESLKQENKHLKENLDLADSDFKRLLKAYEYVEEINEGNERIFVWLTFSVLFNVSLIAIIVMLLNR